MELQFLDYVTNNNINEIKRLLKINPSLINYTNGVSNYKYSYIHI
jgi:hypothetical protein